MFFGHRRFMRSNAHTPESSAADIVASDTEHALNGPLLSLPYLSWARLRLCSSEINQRRSADKLNDKADCDGNSAQRSLSWACMKFVFWRDEGRAADMLTDLQVVMATWRSDFNYSGDQSWLGWPGNWGNAADGCTSTPISALIQKASGECPLSGGLPGPAYFMGPNVN